VGKVDLMAQKNLRSVDIASAYPDPEKVELLGSSNHLLNDADALTHSGSRTVVNISEALSTRIWSNGRGRKSKRCCETPV